MKRLIIINFVILLIISCGDKSNKEDAQGYITSGWNYYQNKKYDEAISQFNKGIQLASSNIELAEAYTGVGFSYLQKGEYQLAMDNFNKAMNTYPYIHSYVGKASCYFSMQMYEKEKNLIRYIILPNINETYKFPYYPEIDYYDLCAMLAFAYYNLEDYTNAKIYVLKAGDNPLAKEIEEKLNYL